MPDEGGRRADDMLVGVGYSSLAIRTIYPQPHDIPRDMIVTETGVVA